MAKARGRSRQPVVQMRLSAAEFLETAPLEDLRDVLRVRHEPVRDPLSYKYNFVPTPEGAEHYIEGTVANDFAGKKATGPEAAKELIGRRNRAKWHVVTSVQKTMWFGEVLARQRQADVDTVLVSAKKGLLFNDHDTQIGAADAVEDFGQALRGDETNPAALIEYDGDLGNDIAHVGIELTSRPDLFLRNTVLLELVSEEQQRRQEFFGGRLEAVREKYGDKLPLEDKQAEVDLRAYIARKRQLMPGQE